MWHFTNEKAQGRKAPGLSAPFLQALLWEKLSLFRPESLLDHFHDVHFPDNVLMNKNNA